MKMQSAFYLAGLLLPLCAHAQGVGLPQSVSIPDPVVAHTSPGNTIQLPPDTGHDDVVAKSSSDNAALLTPKTQPGQEHKLFNALNLSSESSERIRSSIKFCAESMDKAVRLSCYEDFSRSMGVPVKDIAESNEAGSGVWAVKNDNHTYDYIAMLQSPRLNGEDDQHIDLYVRCRQKQMSFYMKPGINIGEQSVQVAIGGDGVSDGKMYQMKPSKTGDAFGFWNDAQARVMYLFFADYNNPMPVSYTLDGHTYKTTFDLKRMYSDTAQVRMACKK